MKNKRITGAGYEEKAVLYLTDRGYRIRERNFRYRQGEIDIIAEHNDDLVFIEVKFRSDSNKGDPLEAVNYSKQRRISRAADFYMLKYHIDTCRACRFDVVSVLGEQVQILENAFDYIEGI